MIEYVVDAALTYGMIRAYHPDFARWATSPRRLDWLRPGRRR